MKVLFVSCCPTPRRMEGNRSHPPPLNVGYLAAVIEREGIDAAIVDMRLPDCGMDAIENTITAYQPDLIGISCLTASFPKAIATAQQIKRLAPTIPIILGGCHVTFTAESTLRENPEIDIAVRGEGEATLLELIRCIETKDALDKVQGISYRRNDNVILHTADRPYISDLNTLPWPARHLMPLLKYDLPGSLTASRGCPHRCIFCAGTAMSGHRYRIRQPYLVVDEIEHLHTQYGIKEFLFLDDTFTALPKRLTIPVCQEIVARRLNITFACESRVDAITPHLVEHLVRAGARGMQLGIESGAQEILDKIGKRITLQQVYNAVRWAREGGLRVGCCFMMGHPDDTEETVHQTAQMIRELKAMGVTLTPVSVFTPFPGTDSYEKREWYGLRQEEFDWSKFTTWYPVFSTRNLSREKIRELYMELLSEFVPAGA